VVDGVRTSYADVVEKTSPAVFELKPNPSRATQDSIQQQNPLAMTTSSAVSDAAAEPQPRSSVDSVRE
jgi:hypothetical protein